jgi:hypothetical protein
MYLDVFMQKSFGSISKILPTPFLFLVNSQYTCLYTAMKHMAKQTETSSFLVKEFWKLWIVGRNYQNIFVANLPDSSVYGKLEDT